MGTDLYEDERGAGGNQEEEGMITKVRIGGCYLYWMAVSPRLGSRVLRKAEPDARQVQRGR